MGGERIDVLLMALGGPDSLDAVEPFLRNVRHGRPTPSAMVEEFRERYRQIGGKSPLLDISIAQAKALEARLNEDAGRFRTYIGMRHWSPYIRETVARMQEDGTRQAVAICLTPYYSRMSVGAYFADLKRAIVETRAAFEVVRVERWCDAPQLSQAFADKVRGGLARLATAGHRDPLVLFTAHSLPERIMREGDPYERELRQTMTAVRKQLPPIRARLCYQSAGRTGEPWLGPPLQTVLEELGDREKSVLIVPFGFVSDHLEILYDLDIEAKGRAAELGVRLERADSLNVDSKFIDAMAGVVRNAARLHGWT